MTACLYISPDDVPALITDSLVTDTSLSGSKILTPANDSIASGNLNYSCARLARKLYLFGERTALSVAGDEGKILEFLSNIKPMVKYIEKEDRPMRLIGDAAEEYTKNNKRQIEVLGVSVADVPNGLRINSTTGYFSETMPILGKCGAIGSGTTEVLSLAKEWVADMLGTGTFKHDTKSTILGFSSFICSERLTQEFLKVHTDNYDWGGYVEHAYFNPEIKKWIRGGKRLHLFFVAFRMDEKRMTIALPKRLILYDPGEADGHVLTVTIERDGTRQSREWLLENILEEDQSVARFRGPAYWNGWRPEAASFVIVLNDSPNGEPHCFISASSVEMKDVYFDMKSHSLEYGISDQLMDNIGQQYCASMGLKYIPHRTLS